MGAPTYLSNRADDQFQDAEDAADVPSTYVAGRAPGHYIDDVPVDGDGDYLPEEDGLDEEYDDEEEGWGEGWEEEGGGGMDQINDQDWEAVSGDLTKRYNRMRQHLTVTQQQHPSSSTSTTTPKTNDLSLRAPTLLPPSNRTQKKPTAPSDSTTNPTSSSSGTKTHPSKLDDQLLTLSSKFSTAVNLSPLPTLHNVSATATRKGGAESNVTKDKSERATNEQVLDPRTRLILFKMIGRGVVGKVEGCVSTGKEANVYHALSPQALSEDASTSSSTTPPSQTTTTSPQAALHPYSSLALKIYKTSILIFKDRSSYISGEYRFRTGYAKSNPRKMVRLWAEKELRNLKRLGNGGVRCPGVVEGRENVLVMEFLGDGWRASPRLKDAELPADRLSDLYAEMVSTMRIMYKKCRLVHADLSEYNVLYHQSHLYIIDVSQSVEHDHPLAYDFLRQDIKNVDDFFSRRGVRTLGMKGTFEFVTGGDERGDGETEETLMERVGDLAGRSEREPERSEEEEPRGVDQPASKTVSFQDTSDPSLVLPPSRSQSSYNDEAVFQHAYIPRNLNEVFDVERDVAKVQRGEGKDLIYSNLVHGAATPAVKSKAGEEEEGDEDEDDEDDEDEDGEEDEEEDTTGGEEGEGELRERKLRGKKFEDKDAKKERKRAVKDEKREKRKEKMPKSAKKKQIKKTSGKKK